jgi:3-oxoacyl-[acyl-carrier protein] reductase
MNVQGKVAVVTGASRGVGRASALALAKSGCSILINYSRSRDEAEQTAAEVRLLGVKAACLQGDVADDRACRETMAWAAREFGRLDILINNAATTEFIPHSQLDALSDEHWDRLFAVNVKGAFFCARAAKQYMEAAGEGVIVNVSSIAGITGIGSSIAYCASKAALINLTMSLARVLAPRIRVNSVAPGFIASKWTQEGLGSNYEATKAAKATQAALGRVCEPEDVAEVIVGLIKNGAMITGQTIVCDGGALIGAKV